MRRPASTERRPGKSKRSHHYCGGFCPDVDPLLLVVLPPLLLGASDVEFEDPVVPAGD
jgi:hypothetical protein